MARGREPEDRSRVASALQNRLSELLVTFVSAVRRQLPARRRLCLGGSLFYNSCFNARIKTSGIYDDVFIPADPGNAGLALGAVLEALERPPTPVSPFLGPSYSSEEIKETLDNCKLTYEWVSESDGIELAVRALQKGRIVAWFDDRMEWGPRALGARCILASPFSKYVLDNLNRFLKQREPWRGYALTGTRPAVGEFFEGPDNSAFMECDFEPRDRDMFQHILPGPRASVRLQTVDNGVPSRFRALLDAFGTAAGAPVLVNTSFNGFREPIVCSPRDAVRVFFGTGIDLLVLGQFVIGKGV
jgi:carbamoyltransferase